MNLALFSIVLFLAAVITGIVCRINCGLTAMLAAFILVQFFIPDMTLKDIYTQGWPVSTFFMMLSILLLFGIAGANGTMEVVARKIMSLTGGRVRLIPLCIFLLTFVLSAAGAGPGIAPVMLAIAMGISRETGLNCFMLGIIVECGAGAGGMSPVSTSGIIAGHLIENAGITGSYMGIWIPYVLLMSVEALAVWLLCGGHREGQMKARPGSCTADTAMNRGQRETAAVVAGVLFCVIVLRLDISMTAMAGSVILLLLGVIEEKKAISVINWSTLLLVGGMYMLITVVDRCGGISLIAETLSGAVSAETGTGVMALLSSLMATVTSASGVVMPTLIPVCREISASTGGTVSALLLTAGVASGANCAFFSPFSILGSMTLAMYPETEDHRVLFKRHVQMTCASIAFVTLLGLAGLLYIPGL
ncbi:MAG: SLC13 family permease [Emergencia sp.]